MRILMVAAELAPLAKTGGLADAVAGLSRALARRGHDVRVLLPRYDHLPPPGVEAAPLAGGGSPFRYLELPPDAARPRAWLLEPDEASRGNGIYTGDDRDAARFLRLCAAALDVGAAAGWQPDILHCHDWHAALVPVLRRRAAHAPRCLLTLHNVGYQGIFGVEVLERSGLVHRDELAEAHGDTVNFLREGIRAADALSTVSPTYASEIRTSAYGMGLEDLLAARGEDLVGILNGVDYDTWSPERDPYLPERYSAADPRPKRRIKDSLRAELGLDTEGDAPLVGAVTRLVEQKGMDLLVAALPELLASTRAQFALLGNGDPALAARLAEVARAHPARVAFAQGYDEALGHRILAGADIVVVPSRYEPCGLTQLYALRYGTVPVVRMTGGLADTVQHFDPATGTGTGAVFRDADVGGVLWGLRQALGWYEDRTAWARLMANGMACDYSWDHQAPLYEALYGRLAAA
ncbi:MAG TPA: glycogen synthase [Gammaproteobacteria bacterium]